MFDLQLAAGREKRAPVTVHYHHYNELPSIKPVALPPIQPYDTYPYFGIISKIT